MGYGKPKPSFGKFFNPSDTPAWGHLAETTSSYDHLARKKSMRTLITNTQALYENRAEAGLNFDGTPNKDLMDRRRRRAAKRVSLKIPGLGGR